MEDKAEDESIVSEAFRTSRLDERTLACSPVPMIASSALRHKGYVPPRGRLRLKDSFEGDESSLGTQSQDSLGLLPSKLLSGMDGSELPLANLISSLPGHSSLTSEEGELGTKSAASGRRSQEMVTTSGSSTADASKLVTVLKSANTKPSEGRLLPQILFPSPLPAQIEEEPGQGKAEQDVSQPIQGDSFAHVLSRVTLSTGGTKNLLPKTNEENEADHTLHQINRQLSTKVYEVPYAAKVNEFFRLLKQVALEAEDIEELEEVCFDLDGSFSDEEPNEGKDVLNQTSLPGGGRPSNDMFPSFLYKARLPRESDSAEDKSENFLMVSNSSQGGQPMNFEEQPSQGLGGFNPFEAQSASFMDAVFEKEEFNSNLDEDAAKAFLDQDEEDFNKENILYNEGLSMLSIRDPEETYQNMTIGGYMRSGCEPVDHLRLNSQKPHLGFAIQSPPTYRRAVPAFTPDDEANSSLTDRSVRLSPVGGTGSKVTSPTEEPPKGRTHIFQKTVSPEDHLSSQHNSKDKIESFQTALREKTTSLTDNKLSMRSKSDLFMTRETESDKKWTFLDDNGHLKRDTLDLFMTGQLESCQKSTSLAYSGHSNRDKSDFETTGKTLSSQADSSQKASLAGSGHSNRDKSDFETTGKTVSGQADSSQKVSLADSGHAKSDFEMSDRSTSLKSKTLLSGSDKSYPQICSKANSMETAGSPVDSPSGSKELDNMEMTFSHLHELLEKSDFSISSMAGPGQDQGEFILALLRQNAMQKRQELEGRSRKGCGGQPDKRLDSGSAAEGELVEGRAGFQSRGKKKQFDEEASGDATFSRLRSSEGSDAPLMLSEMHTSSSGRPYDKTAEDVAYLLRKQEETADLITKATRPRVMGDDANSTSQSVSSFFKDPQKDAEADRTLGLKDLTLSDMSVFKVPLPVSTKGLSSKGKSSSFKSRIPQHVHSASTKQSVSSDSKLQKSVRDTFSSLPSVSTESRQPLPAQDKLSSAPGVLHSNEQSTSAYATDPTTTIVSSIAQPAANTLSSVQRVCSNSKPPMDVNDIFSSPPSSALHSQPPAAAQEAWSESLTNQRPQASGNDTLPALPRSSSHPQPLASSMPNREKQRGGNSGHEGEFSLAEMTSTLDTFTEETMMRTMLPASETSITPMTPRTVVDLLQVPEKLCMEEPCCVSLSTTSVLPLVNLVQRGIKCSLTTTAVIVTLDGRQQQINPAYSPFTFKREITLAAKTSDSVTVIFRPKGKGTFMALIEVTATPMSNVGERRVYMVTLSGTAEFPTLEMCPASEKIDFGDMLCGTSRCKSIRIKNIGQATLPLCFSLLRTDSSQCMFSFQPEKTASGADISSISLTNRPSSLAGVSSSILSVSLPGRVEGQEVKTETINIFCNTKAVEKWDQNRNLTRAEKSQAKLQVRVDQPVEELAPLATISLSVNTGLYKLQVDTSELAVVAAAGECGRSTVKLFNMGSIAMPVRVFLETSDNQFSVNPSGDIVVPPGQGSKKGSVSVSVTFTPRPGLDVNEEQIVNLMFSNQMCNHYIPVTGRLRTTPSTLSSFNGGAKMVPFKLSSSTMHLNFGGVQIGHSRKEKLHFAVDKDVVVQISIKQETQAFMILDVDGDSAKETVEYTALKGKKHKIWVIFEPSTVACYSAALVIQELCTGTRYRVSLRGYGGCGSVQVEQVNLAHSETSFWLDMGRLNVGVSIFREFVVRNNGSRCSFIKATFCDASRTDFAPTRATVMPSSLILPPGEAQKLLAMFCPGQKELALCQTGHALVGIIKLEHGDNIVREMFLREPGRQPRQVISLYDIPVSSTLREVVDAELVGVDQVRDSYSALRKAVRKINIGVFGDGRREESSPTTAQQGVPSSGSDLSDTQPRPSLQPSSRPALTQLNPNLSPRSGGPPVVSLPDTVVRDTSVVVHSFKNSSSHPLHYQLEPFTPAYVKKSSGSQTVEAAGYSVFSVSPCKGTLQPGLVLKVSVTFSPERLGSYNQVWTVVDVKHSGKQVHRFTVFAKAIQERPTRLSDPQQQVTPLSPGRHYGTPRQAPSLADVEAIQSTRSHGHTSPPSSADGLSHRRLIQNEMAPRNLEKDLADICSGPAVGSEAEVTGSGRPRPFWSSVEQDHSSHAINVGNHREPVEQRVVSPALSSISGDSSAARRASPVNSSSSSSPENVSLNRSAHSRCDRSDRQEKGPHLVHSSLEFPAITSGTSSVQKLFIKNRSSEDAQLAVEYEPRPPFLVQHLKFKVGSRKMTVFPVTFKPRHVDRFKDKIVFRDAVTGRLLTATLLAESKAS